jgi:hypothetical protein
MFLDSAVNGRVRDPSFFEGILLRPLQKGSMVTSLLHGFAFTPSDRTVKVALYLRFTRTSAASFARSMDTVLDNTLTDIYLAADRAIEAKVTTALNTGRYTSRLQVQCNRDRDAIYDLYVSYFVDCLSS